MVRHRALGFVLVFVLLLAVLVRTVPLTYSHLHAHYAHLAFALMNAGFLAYAIYHYIGWRNSVEDLRKGIALAKGLVNGAGSHPLVPATISLDRPSRL